MIDATGLAVAAIGAAGCSLVQLGAALIWGARLDQRVKTLEDDMKPLRAMAETLGRLDERIKGLKDAFDEFNRTTEWMRGTVEPIRSPPRQAPAP